MSEAVIVDTMRHWVDDVVIHHNFCPFARFVRHPETIHYEVCDKKDIADVMVSLHGECRRLDEHKEVSTTLLILPSLASFDDYLDGLSLAQSMMSQWHYDGVYQLASFHPDYQFEGEEADAPSNYTNRAPFPVFHLIREDDISRALESYSEPERIFEENIARTEALGCDHLQAQLEACHMKAKETR